jgi:hypothetical protein
MQKTQLSVRGQIALGLAVALIFSLIFVFVGTMASNQESDKMAAFASDGAVTTGTITKKYIHVIRSAGSVWVYWLDLSFRSPDGATHNESEEVANTIYDRYQAGDPVQVTYVKAKPEWFYVPGDAPSRRNVDNSAGMHTIGIWGAVLSAFGLVALFFVTQSDGSAPSGGTPSVSLSSAPDEAVARPVPGQRRATFGTRRAAR